jgi:tetratricopeptide (TPR) repeat protein
MANLKYLLTFLTFFVTTLQSQTVLKFDKLFVESENKWITFPKGKDSTYIYGFIYIDTQAGLTLNYEGKFKISENGTFVPKKIDSANIKIRLQPSAVLVAFIPEVKFQELQIPLIPEWLKYYKTDTTSVERLYKYGFIYNEWNECTKALTYLEKAQKINQRFNKLAVELAFSYNCLSKFDKAITVLQNALEENPADAYTNKELIYAQLKLGQLENAAVSCQKAIKICTDKTYNGENCYNLLHNYYLNKDKANFNLWLSETKKWTSSNADMTRSIKIMENEFSK